MRCRYWRLLWATLALTVCLIGGSSLADGLVVDDATYTVDSDLSFDTLCIGKTSTGTLNQTGGNLTVPGILFLGYDSGSSGIYNLSGGTLSAGFGFVGYRGVGVFNQSGGINRISYNLQLGFSAGSSGTYNLSGGSLFTSTLYVGKDGSGIFNQSGGSTTIEKLSSVSGLYLGYYSGRSGTYNLSGGSLSAPAGTIGVLVGGVGIFNQSGGTNTIFNELIVGRFDPPHLGHSHMIEWAAQRCDLLVVFVNTSPDPSSVIKIPRPELSSTELAWVPTPLKSRRTLPGPASAMSRPSSS